MKNAILLILSLTLLLGTAQSALALTQEECQVKRESLDSYIATMEEIIRYQFATRNRYRYANKLRIEKQINQAELEFYNACPDYVYPQ